MKKITFLLVLCAILCTSCAKHIIVNFQDSSENTGTIVLAPTAPIQGSVLTVNDKLIVDKKFVKKITVKNVPVGENQVNFSADSWAYKEKIDLKVTINTQSNKEVAKIVTRPPYSTGYYVLMAASILVSLSTTIFYRP
jgi:hypothetical protein